jgi:hypothetical protein
LESREAEILIDGKSRKCVLRDLSFSGAKVVVSGRAEAFSNRSVSLKFSRSEQVPEMTLPATVLRVDEVGGRKDILAVSVEYSSDPPMSYKLLINSYISTMRKAAQAAQEAQAQTAASAPAAEPAPAQAGETPVAESPSPDIPSEGDPEESG